MTASAVAIDRTRPGLGRWGATALLSACFALSYVDRQVMSLLVTPIKASLDLTDSGIGLLQGISFSLFYVAASLPLARLADRGDRPRLAALCIAIWSLMTMACGAAASFMQLLAARIGLAMSEAGLPPAALTLMADMHDRRGLARATSLFMLAPFVGGGLALIGGGALYAALVGMDLPAGLEPWQALFILAGLPGLPLALIVLLTLREPGAGRRQRAEGGSIRDLSRFIFGNWRFSVIYVLAIALVVTILNAHIAWLPTAILRRFPIGEAAMGAGFGTIYLIAGSAGTLAAGWVVARAAESDMLIRTLRQMRLGAALLAIPAVLAPLAPSYPATIVLAGIAVFLTSAVVSMGSIPFQLTAPIALRGQAIALTGLFAALLGTGLGPLLVGVASDIAAGAGFAQPLSVALAVIGGTVALLVATLMTVAGANAPPIDQSQPTAKDRI
jgi:predicted MFS family arabinose efflux permease